MKGGGERLDWMKPLDPDGNLYEGRLGCLRGDSEYMNVRNPQPGMTYAYPGRDRGQILEAKRKGYTIIGPGDPEYIGQSEDPDLQRAGLLDTTYQGIDTILAKCPTELVSERRKLAEVRRQAALTGGTEEYLAGEDPEIQRRYGKGRPIRYALPQHGIERDPRPR